MKSFFKLREELDSCCDECADDTLYGSVEEDFEPTGEEQYEDWDEINEGGPGLWANIHAKRQRIKAGSGERMREPGSKGAPTSSPLKRAAESYEDLDEAKDTDKYTYIDQSKGPVIKGKSGTYVGYTHSATKGKGANILKHNQTKKYYAAGGSSTAFTLKTTLHDTPEDAARAYHKGNLAEASPMIKPPKNEFGKKEDAFAHAKKHGGKVMKKTFTHPTSGMQTVSYVVKEDSEQIDELKRTTLANYVSKAAGSYGRDKQVIGRESPDGTVAKARPELKRAVKNRLTGINRAAERLAKEETEIDEASKKPNATTRHLRQYPVSDKEMAKPVKQSEYQHHVVSKLDGNVLASYKSKEAAHRNAYGNPVVSGSLETIGDRKYVREQSESKPITYYSLVHKATNKVLSTHKDLESAKDEHRGMDQGERAHYRIATSTKAPKSFSMKEDVEGVAEDISSTKKKISKYEELALAANRAGDDAKSKQYQQKIQVLKQKMSQGVAEGYTGRETKDGTWRVFKDGQAVAVAGPFKSRDEAHAWIKNHKQGVAEGLKLQEAEKGGRKVQLNKPFRTSDGKGKFAVYTKNEKGNVVKVNFGDTTGLTIKTSNPDRRRNFRARHNCDNPGPRHKARFWSCRSWSRDNVSAGLGIK